MKNQALFFSKDKSKQLKMSSAAIFVGALRVKSISSRLQETGRNKEIMVREKISKQPPPATTAATVGPCPAIVLL